MYKFVVSKNVRAKQLRLSKQLTNSSSKIERAKDMNTQLSIKHTNRIGYVT
jgi:hypothetical protein